MSVNISSLLLKKEDVCRLVEPASFDSVKEACEFRVSSSPFTVRFARVRMKIEKKEQ